MFTALSWFSDFWRLGASGIVDATWTLVWHWGLGTGLIILCLAGAYLSPINKGYFLGAAAVVAVGLWLYGEGQRDDRKLCEAKVKYIYLKAHPKITKNNIAKNWTVSPSWDPSKLPNYRPVTQPQCSGPFDTSCWGSR